MERKRQFPGTFKGGLNPVQRYAIAVLMVIAAALLRFLLISVLGATSPYITFYLAIVIAAAIGGFGPGLLVTIAGAGFSFTILLPKGAAAMPLEVVRLSIYLLSGIGISLIAEAMHRHRRSEQERTQELRRAKGENEKSLAQLEAVINSMDESLVISDLGGHIQAFNPAALRLHGFADIEDARRHISEFPDLFEVKDLAGEPLPVAIWPLARALRGEVFTHHEIRVRRRDTGREFIGSYSGSPVRDDQGVPILATVTIRDVTDQKRAEEDLRGARMAAEDANRAKSEYLAKMSHEIRNPMTVILGALEQVALTDPPPTEQRPFIDMATTAAQRLLGIINDVLDISKIEARQVTLEARPFDLRECVGRAIGIFALAAQEKGLTLHWQVDPEIALQVKGDPNRLGQVLVNLVGNAVKFTEKGEVAVNVSKAEDGITFTVSDTGIGIPKDKREQIFEPFNQGDDSRPQKYGGTGLGLTISRELVELMGGTIAVESDLGRGSSFTFTLALPPMGAIAERQTPETLQVAARPMRILVAEDEPAVRGLVEKTLRRRGWEVDLAENGRQAVDRWEQGGVDIVLMDIKMPQMDGIAATRQIRDRERKTGRRPCIVALTAHARPEDRKECLAAGMDAFLTKPMRIGELELVLKNCLH